eukprot:COSAG01_NODE_34643_length_544_cov_0.979775_1_plen_143_part_01
MWKELNWVWDTKKSELYRFGSPVVPPVVGTCLVLHEGRIRLPAAKPTKYIAAIDAVLGKAAAHPQQLVPAEEVESCLGKLIHAADIAFNIWIFFLDLIAELRGCWRSRWVQLKRHARARLRDIKGCLQAPFGRPLASYELRPG